MTSTIANEMLTMWFSLSIKFLERKYVFTVQLYNIKGMTVMLQRISFSIYPNKNLNGYSGFFTRNKDIVNE